MHNIKAIFVVYSLAIYLGLCTIHCLFGYLIHANGETMRTKANFIFIPLHVAFIATILTGMLNNDYSAKCTEEKVFPVIFLVSAALFGILFVVTVNCYCVEYMLRSDQ